MMHALVIREEIEVVAHTEEGASELAVFKLKPLLPEHKELLHLLLGQAALKQQHIIL